MKEKYLIRLENEAIALRYDLITGELMIGGAYRLRQDIEAFIEEYFGAVVPHPTFPQQRKVRYNLKVAKRAFDAGLKRLKESGLIQKVENLGRIAR